jgi:hypothetical protein
MSEDKQEEKKDYDIDAILKGLEMNVVHLQKRLSEDAEGLTAKQVKRVIQAILQYPEEPKLSDKTEREQKFVAGVFSLHESQVLLELNVIDNMRKEAVDKQLAEERKSKGE